MINPISCIYPQDQILESFTSFKSTEENSDVLILNEENLNINLVENNKLEDEYENQLDQKLQVIESINKLI